MFIYLCILCVRVVARSHCSILCLSLSELVVAPRSGSFSVCILCVSLSELLLGVVAPHSGSFSVSMPCICCDTCTVLSNVVP